MSTLNRDDENERAILSDYVRGTLSRSAAMNRLGLDWYGDLLLKMNELGIKRPVLPAADMIAMQKSADEVLSTYVIRSKPKE